MCFSPEASFTAAALLCGGGAWLTKRWRGTSFSLLALMPPLFGLQQLSEGLLWLTLPGSYQILPPMLEQPLTYLYLFFAILLWPVYLPLSFLQAEPLKGRRRLLYLPLLLGVIFSVSFAWVALYTPVKAAIAWHSVTYNSAAPQWYALYFVAAMAPFFLSSMRGAAWLGSFFLIACVVAFNLWRNSFVSVWCFFAAFISIGIWLLVEANSHIAVKDLKRASRPR